MNRIPEYLEQKYHMRPYEEAVKRDEMTYYKTFLIQTDHIPNKIIEAQVLGEELNMNLYNEILECRKYCREKINELQLAI